MVERADIADSVVSLFRFLTIRINHQANKTATRIRIVLTAIMIGTLEGTTRRGESVVVTRIRFDY